MTSMKTHRSRCIFMALNKFRRLHSRNTDMLTQIASLGLLQSKKKARFSNDRFGLKETGRIKRGKEGVWKIERVAVVKYIK